MATFRTALALLLALPLAAASCSGGGSGAGSSGEETADAGAIIQEKERGPVKVTLRVEPKEPTFADRISFEITAEAEEGVEVTLPPPARGLAAEGEGIDPTRFLIRDFVPIGPRRTAAGRTLIGRSYTLEVLTSGTFTIGELEIAFTDRRGGGETSAAEGAAPAGPENATGTGAGTGSGAKTAGTEADGGAERVYKILTDPITIEVRPLEDTAALEEVASIEGPRAPPVVPPSLAWPLGIAAGLAGAAGLALVAVRLLRRRREAPVRRIPAEELAYRELEWLIEQGFVERGEHKEFFFHLSRIVREYIERRFGLRAPERTTEEFLDELSRSDALSPAHRRLLERFLEKADMVKFARYAPGAEEITASFDAGKEFVAETRRSPEELAGAAP